MQHIILLKSKWNGASEMSNSMTYKFDRIQWRGFGWKFQIIIAVKWRREPETFDVFFNVAILTALHSKRSALNTLCQHPPIPIPSVSSLFRSVCRQIELKARPSVWPCVSTSAATRRVLRQLQSSCPPPAASSPHHLSLFTYIRFYYFDLIIFQ